MIKLHYTKAIWLVFVLFPIYSYGVFGGIINTQTSINTQYELSKEALDLKKKEVEDEISGYEKQLKKTNAKIKKSIKLIISAIEIKKNTLVKAKQLLHETQNTRK